MPDSRYFEVTPLHLTPLPDHEKNSTHIGMLKVEETNKEYRYFKGDPSFKAGIYKCSICKIKIPADFLHYDYIDDKIVPLGSVHPSHHNNDGFEFVVNIRNLNCGDYYILEGKGNLIPLDQKSLADLKSTALKGDYKILEKGKIKSSGDECRDSLSLFHQNIIGNRKNVRNIQLFGRPVENKSAIEQKVDYYIPAIGKTEESNGNIPDVIYFKSKESNFLHNWLQRIANATPCQNIGIAVFFKLFGQKPIVCVLARKKERRRNSPTEITIFESSRCMHLSPKSKFVLH